MPGWSSSDAAVSGEIAEYGSKTITTRTKLFLKAFPIKMAAGWGYIVIYYIRENGLTTQFFISIRFWTTIAILLGGLLIKFREPLM